MHRTHVADSVEDALHGVAGRGQRFPGRDAAQPRHPVPHALLHARLWVADAVYTPLWTPLLTAARAKGAKVMTGRELAIYASADAFELFTGHVPCTAEMGIAFDDVMARRYSAPDAA